jgi:membrane protease YdiL (CAAX protease family)
VEADAPAPIGPHVAEAEARRVAPGEGSAAACQSPSWRGWMGVEVLAVLCIGMIPAIRAAIHPASPRMMAEAPMATIAGELIFRSIITTIPILYIAHVGGLGWAELGLHRLRPLRDTLWGLAILPAMAVPLIGWWVIVAIVTLVVGQAGREIADAGPKFHPAVPGWLGIAAIVVGMGCNAFAEEVVMRGYLLRRLREIGLGVAGAVVVSSVLFGAYHLYQGWAVASVAVGVGAVLAAMMLWLRRLWPLVIAHMLWDLMSIGAHLLRGAQEAAAA